MSRLEPQPADPIICQAPFWQPIGRLVFAFGHLEKQIDWCISALLHADSEREEPSVASQIRNLCSRIALVEALFRLLTADETRQAELHSIIKQLRALIKFRNGLLHGPWGAYLDDRRTWQKPRTNPVDLSPGVFRGNRRGHRRARPAGRAEIGNALVKLIQEVAEEHAARAVHAP